MQQVLTQGKNKKTKTETDPEWNPEGLHVTPFVKLSNLKNKSYGREAYNFGFIVSLRSLFKIGLFVNDVSLKHR